MVPTNAGVVLPKARNMSWLGGLLLTAQPERGELDTEI
jgi:hypothetical protein